MIWDSYKRGICLDLDEFLPLSADEGVIHRMLRILNGFHISSVDMQGIICTDISGDVQVPDMKFQIWSKTFVVASADNRGTTETNGATSQGRVRGGG